MISTFYATKMTLSLDKRYEIAFLHEHPAGPKWGYEKIAKHVRCSKPTVIYWVKKYQENKDLTEEKRSGRPRCTTELEDERIVKMAKKNYNATSIEIQQEFEKKGVDVSERTIRRRLSEAGGKFVKEVQKPLLSERHRVNRLKWAKNYQNFD